MADSRKSEPPFLVWCLALIALDTLAHDPDGFIRNVQDFQNAADWCQRQSEPGADFENPPKLIWIAAGLFYGAIGAGVGIAWLFFS